MLNKLFERLDKKKLLEYGGYLFILVFILFIVPTFLLERIGVDGDSMETTLQDKDHVLIEKVSRYFDGPDRFDVIVFHKGKGADKDVYIKRVIGMPGDTIQIIEGFVFINDEFLTEDVYGKDIMAGGGIAEEPLTLGKDEYFVLGDNRLYSKDSRNAAVGIVKKSDIDGVVISRVFPLNKFGNID